MIESDNSGHFLFHKEEQNAVGSVLYKEHLKRTDKNRMADFAGYLMPLWFSSISSEHRAVRETAGLFDCTHMGILQIKGESAQSFLNQITANNVDKLTSGLAQYSFIIDAAGNILDDIIIYKLSDDNFMVVVNAANEPKIKAYLNALQENKVIIDLNDRSKKLGSIPVIRDMRDSRRGSDCRVDIALQGPASLDYLLSRIKNETAKKQILELKPFNFVGTELDGCNCIISHTGYTGASISYELFVHPDKAAELWDYILKNGKSFGIIPCGLGARDSLRIEAGLPLYGHELEGEFGINPYEAGYGWVIKLKKDFFIGQAVMKEKAQKKDMQVARIEIPGKKGIRPIRNNDAVLNENGVCIGWVLSCAKVQEKQIALAYIMKEFAQEDNCVGLYYLARNSVQIQKGKKENVKKNEILEPDISGKIVTRFAKF